MNTTVTTTARTIATTGTLVGARAARLLPQP